MSLRDYLRLEGGCAVVLGVALIAIAVAFGRWDGPAWTTAAVAVVGSVLAVLGARAATRSALRDAEDGLPRMSEQAVRRQTIAETALWVTAVAVWVVLTGDSAELVAGTGVASVVFGLVRRSAVVPDDAAVAHRRYVLGATVAIPAAAAPRRTGRAR